MRAFAAKQNQTHQTNDLTKSSLAKPIQKLESDHGLPFTAPAFGRDFSRIPLHSETLVMIQPKLAISTPGDMFEQEADRIADQVMRTPEPQLQPTSAGNRECQMSQIQQEPLVEHLQTKSLQANPSVLTTVPPVVHEVLSSPGKPLDAATRAFMEPRFGHDFSRVRVHTDGKAAESAGTIEALAYTVGHHIALGPGQYEPATKTGQRLLAHELTHVLQQTTGSYSIIQRQTGKQGDKGKKPGLKKGSQLMIKGGKLEVKGISFEYERISPNEGKQSVSIELAYIREAESEYLDPTKINWFQTYRTNYQTDSSEAPPKDIEIKDFVDGSQTKDRQEACWLNQQNGSILSDALHRRSLPDRNVYWKAETSVVGISDDGPEILATVDWGFEMDRKGNSKNIPLRRVTTPSAYHLLKFQELRSRKE